MTEAQPVPVLRQVLGFGPKNPRSNRACVECRARKIRCDHLERYPCSSCTTGKRVCKTTSPVRSTHSSNNIANTQYGSRPPSPLGALCLSGPGGGAIVGGASVTTLNQQMVPSDVGAGLQASPDSQSRSPKEARQHSSAGDDHVWAHMMENTGKTVSDPSNAKTGSGTLSSMDGSSEPLRKRVKFGGEPLAHSMLSHMDGHTEMSIGSSRQGTQRVDPRRFRQTTGPKAIHPQGKGPWLHANCQGHLDLLAHLPSEDQYYLYNMKEVFYFPQRSVTDALMTTFFESVHPLLPIVDKRSVLGLYERMYTHQLSSPLLMHSILFAACQFADESLFHDAGFNSVLDGKVYFFRCAKILYSHDCEPDQLSVVQSLIFLTFWWMDYMEEKDLRFWVSCAVTLALSMGMHKTVTKSIHMPPAQYKTWRRTFWILFSREHTIAVALGLPFLLHLNDCDLQPLSKMDFTENDEDQLSPSAGDGFATYELASSLQSHIHVALKQVELTIKAEKLLLSLQEAQDHQQALEVLGSKKEIISKAGVYLEEAMAEAGFSVEDASTWTKHNVFPIFLLLYHERLTTLYHRRHEWALIGLQRAVFQRDPRSEDDQVCSEQDSDGQPFNYGIELRQVRTEIFQSAERVIEMLDKLHTYQLLRYAPALVITSCFHALLSIAEQIVTTTKDMPEHLAAKEKYSKGLQAVEHMRKYWKVASWAHSMFQKLAEDDFKSLTLSAERRKREFETSRLNSRFASRLGTPTPDVEDTMLTIGPDFFDLDLYGDPGIAVSSDLFGDWQNAVSLDRSPYGNIYQIS